MNDYMKMLLPALGMAMAGAVAYGDLRSEVDTLNKGVDRAEQVRDDVQIIKGDINGVKSQLNDIKADQKEITILLRSINLKVQ